MSVSASFVESTKDGVPDLGQGLAVEHVLYGGENLDALNLLADVDSGHGVLGEVDFIYIDPPYNTGSVSRTYVDRFAAQDGLTSHEVWLKFMRERLVQAPGLLAETGVIAVSIDDSEVHRLRVLMDEIFGERNFIAQLVVDGGSLKNNARLFSVTHEYILVYGRNVKALMGSGVKWRKQRDGLDKLVREQAKAKRLFGDDHVRITAHLKEWVKTAKLTPRLKKFYNSDARGLYTYADLSAPSQGGTYDVLHPVTGKPCQVPSRGWGLVESKMVALVADDRIIFGADETAQPLKKLYLTSGKDQVQKGILEYPSRSSTHLLERLLGKRSSFGNPKNFQMIRDLVELVTPEDGVVLDYFAGSGTTGHAVLDLNARVKCSERKFILVTNNEAGIFTDVCLPRLTVVAEQLNAKGKDEPQGLKVFLQEGHMLPAVE